jgi:hypothetical protein
MLLLRFGAAGRTVLMALTNRNAIYVAEADEELLTSEVSDDALERAAPIIEASVATLNFGTFIVGNCGCPV